jgi:hypothetical protein
MIRGQHLSLSLSFLSGVSRALRSDFRGGGVLSLHCILYYMERYQSEAFSLSLLCVCVCLRVFVMWIG